MRERLHYDVHRRSDACMQTVREGTTVVGAGSTDVAEDLPRAFGTFSKTFFVVLSKTIRQLPSVLFVLLCLYDAFLPLRVLRTSF